jgi:uncharacterized protein
MRCPRCSTEVSDAVPTCAGCGFGIADLDARLGEPPACRGRVTDDAGLLSPEGLVRIEQRARAFEGRTGAELRVVTRPTSRPCTPGEYAFWLFNRWDVGDIGGQDVNRGLIVLVLRDERTIWCEVGHGLEGIVTDAAAGQILEAHAVPFLARGDVNEGVYQAVDVLAQVVEGGRERPSLWRQIVGGR